MTPGGRVDVVVDAVVSCLGELHTSLVQMVEGKVPLDPSQFAEAHSLINQIESFNFHFLLHCWQKILTASDILSKYLQSDSIDIGNAVALINGFRLEMDELRSNEKFVHFKEMATESLGKLKPSGQTVIRTRQSKTGQEAENHLKVGVYFALHDKMQVEISDRFDDFMKIGSMFASLEPKDFQKESTMANFRKLCDFYEKDVNKEDAIVEFQTLIKTINGIFKDPKVIMIKAKDVLKFLIDAGMDNMFPNMCILYRIYLTIPVTSANAERSFSRGTLIKSYLRTRMGQERFSGLSLISIEREVACRCDYDEVIDNFAAIKNRRKKL